MLGALALSAPPALANHRTVLEVRFLTATPGTPTGVYMRFLYRDENDPDARPPYIRSLFMDLPPGTRIDESAVPACTAGDAEIKAQGTMSCPPETLMAKGTLVARPGTFAEDPFVGDVYFFHSQGYWLEMVTARGSPSVIGYDRFYIEGSRLRAAPAATPGGFPDGETAIREVTFTMQPRIAGGHSFFTTPPTCPADGRWVTNASFTFDDGVPDPTTAVSDCTQFVAAQIDIVVLPKRVHRGRRTRFDVRLAPAGSACARGATVRLGGGTGVTGSDGRAALTATLPKAGLAKATVTRAGCATRRKSIRVLR
ncbi:MAG: hypothetical protein QOE06_1120 [Thermoleophilaceae bacterium]|nr:hypothetical protein [Thermoleophilaceae bacterium]